MKNIKTLIWIRITIRKTCPKVFGEVFLWGKSDHLRFMNFLNNQKFNESGGKTDEE